MALANNPGAFENGFSDSSVQSEDDVYASLTVGMKRADAERILSANNYTGECTSRTTSEGPAGPVNTGAFRGKMTGQLSSLISMMSLQKCSKQTTPILAAP